MCRLASEPGIRCRTATLLEGVGQWSVNAQERRRRRQSTAACGDSPVIEDWPRKKPMRPSSRLAALVAALAFAWTSARGAEQEAPGTLTVFAAASLTDVFREIGKTFE